MTLAPDTHADVWSVLHDGTLQALDPTPDGWVARVTCQYLFARLGRPDAAVALHGRGPLTWVGWDDEAHAIGVSGLVDASVLSATVTGDVVTVMLMFWRGTGGELQVRAEGARLSWSDGDPLEPDALFAAATLYWQDFGHRHP